MLSGGHQLNSNQISILHMSDLQFGAYHRFAGDFDPKNFADWFAASLIENCLSDGETIQLVIVSGDVAEMGLRREFDEGRGFFEQLATNINLHTSDFVFVPGNHDVHWGRSRRITEDKETGDREFSSESEFIKKRDDEKFTYFKTFIADLAAEGIEVGQDARVYDFPQLQISVAALNSCEIETHEIHRGHVSKAQLQKVLDFWNEDIYATRLKLIVVHHNPVAAVPEQRDEWLRWMKTQIDDGKGITEELIQRYADDIGGFDAKADLLRFAEQSAAPLIFFGHQHADDIQSIKKGTSRICLLSAGSSGLIQRKLPGDTPNSFNIVRLDRLTGDLRVQTFSYSSRASTPGLIEPGAFRPDPDRREFAERIALPDGFRPADVSVGGAVPRLAPFVKQFRKQLSAKFSLLDSRFTYVPAASLIYSSGL